MQIKYGKTEFATLLFSLLSKYYRLERDETICYGLSISQYQILYILSAKDFIKMTELGKQLNLAVSTVTRLADVMLKHGWIERGISGKDRRVVTVSITQEGKAILKKINKCRDNLAEKILGGIPVEKHDMIMESVTLLANSFRNCC